MRRSLPVPDSSADLLREKRFLFAVSDENRIRARYTVQRNEPVEIMVQLECWIEDKWRPVRRYDTRHGFLHVHTKPWDKGKDRRVRLDDGLKDALTSAISDLKRNWRRYRAACARSMKEVEKL